MKKLIPSAMLLLCTSALISRAQDNDSSRVVKTSIAPDAASTAEQKAFTITLNISKGWHIYANPVGNPDLSSVQTSVAIKADGVTLPAKVVYPPGTLHKDPLVGDYSTYEGTIKIKVTAPLPRTTGKPPEVVLKYQACNEKTCLAPALANFKLP